MVTAKIQRTDQRKAALIAGISLIIMTLASFFCMALSMQALWYKEMPAPPFITSCHQPCCSKAGKPL